jgi:UPF0716 protein FxsA
MFATLFFFFVTVPLLEIWLLLRVSAEIGGWQTFYIVALTAMLGSYFVRQQGLKTLLKMQAESASGQVPTQAIVDGVFIFISGILLVTPGFVTDIIGFSFLIPPIRRAIAHSFWQSIKDKMSVSTMDPSQMASSFVVGAAQQHMSNMNPDPAMNPDLASPPDLRPGAVPGEIIIDATSVKHVDEDSSESPESDL